MLWSAAGPGKPGGRRSPRCVKLVRMLVTITATRPPGADWPATDLGYLLAKNPNRVQSFEHAFGRSRVFYPQADEAACTAALLLEIDPITLVKSRNLDSADFSLSQ